MQLERRVIHKHVNSLKYGIMIPFLLLIAIHAVGQQLKDKNMKGIVPQGYVITEVKALPKSIFF